MPIQKTKKEKTLEKIEKEKVSNKKKKITKEDEMYKVLYESSKDALMILEPPDWKFTSGNPATIALFGAKDEKEFISKGPGELSPKKQPDGDLSSEKAKKEITKAMKNGSNFFEWTHKKVNGENFFATVLLSKFKLNGKDVLQATVRDISSEKFRLTSEIMKNISEGIYLVQVKGCNIIYNNEKCEKMFGYGHGEMFGKSVKSINASSNRTHEDIKQEVVNTLKKKGEWHSEVEYVKKNGEHFWGQVNASLFDYVDFGEVIVFVVTDMTENKKQAKILEELNEQQQIILDSSPVMIFYKDKENRFIKVNKALADANGTTKAEMEGKTCWELFPKEDADKYWEDDKEVIKSGKSKLGIIEPMQTPSGVAWINTDKVLFRDAAGKVIGIIGFTTDITKIKEAEKVINESEVQVKKKIEELELMNKLMIDRELKMVALKKEIEQLRKNQ